MAKQSDMGLTAKKADFSEWYPQLIIKGDLADYSPVSGCIIFKPRSYAMWEKIKAAVDTRIKDLGVENAYFPLLIPESLLKKEAAHIKGFAPEVAWVDYGGNTKLGERLAIRPTSEAIMYDAYSKWIRSWRDLPLKLNQWNNVVRWEFKHPILFLRTREFLWNEGHTAFATEKEAEQEIPQIITLYHHVTEHLMALPGIIGRKTEKEKFAGAEYTISIEYLLPNGKGIQGPDAHHDGQIFAKAYNISFVDEQEKQQHVWQNTWAITSRMIGVMIAVHSDDKGLVLPPAIAPEHVVIVPILFQKGRKEVLKKAKELQKKLQGYTVILDDREGYSPGWKFNEWELKGVPLRIEIGPKDIAKKQVVMVRRDTGKKEIVKVKGIVKKVKATLDNMQQSLLKKARKTLKDGIITVKTKAQLQKTLHDKKLAQAAWCGSEKCEAAIKETGAKILNMPLKNIKKSIIPQATAAKCMQCGKKGKYLALIGKSY